MQYVAERVAGELAEVVNLARPGQEAHDIELTLAETAVVEQADVVVQIPGFQLALDDVIASQPLSGTVLDVADVVPLLPTEESPDEHAAHADGAASDGGGAEDHSDHDHDGEDGGDGHDHGSHDPHFWMDPTLLAQVATALADLLAEAHPDGAATYTANAEAVTSDLAALDEDLRTRFDAVTGSRSFITSHAAFAYLARRYGLEQVGISGIDPEVEPSPQRLLQLEQVIRDTGATTVFFEQSASPKVATTLADNAGVRAEALDNLETQLDPAVDYLAVMREDARVLVESWTR